MGKFRDIGLVCTAATPTAGAAVLVNGVNNIQWVSFEGVMSSNFFNGFDIRRGQGWVMHDCAIYNFANYGVSVQDSVAADTGDWTIEACQIYGLATSVACLAYFSQGGGRFINNKISAAGNSSGN